MGPVGGTWARRVLTAGWAVLALVVLVAAVDLVRSGWAPVIDNAVVAAMTVDSASLDPPLVGMPTSLGLEGGEPLSHPGPLGFWALALPTTMLGEPGHGLLLGSALVSVATLAAIAAVLRRWDDLALEAVGLALTGGMVLAVGGHAFASPFNPHLGLLPLLLCVLSVAGVVAGRHRQLWVVVVAGSVAAQAHLGYVPLVAALVLLVAVALGVDVARTEGEARGRLTRRIIPVGVGLGLLAWVGPILDQLFGTQNLSRLVTSQADGEPPAGLGHGIDVAIEMTSLPPRWLMGRATDEPLDPGGLRTVLSLAVVALVAGLLVVAVRRRDRALAAVTGVALLSVAAAAVTSARVVNPTASPFFDAESALLYRLFWWPVGVAFSLAALWGVAHLARTALAGRATLGGRELPSPASLRVPLLAALGVGVVVLAVVAVDTRTPPSTALEDYFLHEEPHADAIAHLPGGPDVIVLRFEPEGTPSPPADAPTPDIWDQGPDRRYGSAMNLVAQLRLRGITVRFADEPDDGVVFMRPYRDAHPAQGDESVELLYRAGADAEADPPPGYRLLSRAPSPEDPLVAALAPPTAVFVRS